MAKNPGANAGDLRDTGSIPGSGRCPGERNGNTPQYSCLENPIDRGAWWGGGGYSSVQLSRSVMSNSLQPRGGTVHGVKESDRTEPLHNNNKEPG